MPLQARRVFRLSLTVALALTAGYGLAVDLPFMAPLFALLLTATPGPPMGLKKLLILLLVVLITLGVGLLLIPLLLNYPITAILIVAVGLYFSNYLSVNLEKGLVAVLLTVGITLISSAGTLSWALATTVINALVVGIGIAVACHWLVYPLFPEDGIEAAQAPPSSPATDNWIAIRATFVVLPVYFVALTDPTTYLPIILKAVTLGQQSSTMTARDSGRELLGSTFVGGCFAILFWFALGISINLWMFFLWMLLFGVYLFSKLYQVIPSRHPASFWQNVAVTMLILLGSAVQDSAGGKDVYAAFAVRMGLFVAVTIYAWGAVQLLETWRVHRFSRLRTAPGI